MPAGILLAAALAFGGMAAEAPKASRRSDADIERDIRARLGRSKISVDRFAVKVEGGTATLSGKTDVAQRKGVATRLARLGGAKSVVNRIEVSQAAKDKAAASYRKRQAMPPRATVKR